MSNQLVGGIVLGIALTVALLYAGIWGLRVGEHHCATHPKDSTCVAHLKDGGH